MLIGNGILAALGVVTCCGRALWTVASNAARQSVGVLDFWMQTTRWCRSVRTSRTRPIRPMALPAVRRFDSAAEAWLE